uniref:DUF7356 domain-containing protein n=1 Tax=Leersia perrieri TaxID=77586 RepID=A0A0D9WHQ4_9ORYZ
MGYCRFAALIVLLLALVLILGPAAGTAARVLQGEKASSSEGAPAPNVAAGGSHKEEELGKSSNGNNPVTKETNHQTPAPEKPPKDSTPPPPGASESKGKKGDAKKDSGHPVPSTDVHDTEGPGPTGGKEREGGGSEGKKKPTEETKKAVKCEDAMKKCSVPGEFTACLQVPQDGSIGPSVIVQNDGQNDITVNVEATPNSKMLPLQLAKGKSGQVNITNPYGREITIKSGSEKGQCSIQSKQTVTKQTVSDWQQQFQQFAVYATRMNPIYGASFLIFTVVLVGVVCACCKFARRRASGVPYQQLEMGAQVPNSSGVENTTSTTNGWEDGWDDDWDDEEAPAAKPSDKKPSGTISGNGLSLRPQTNSKDGWDVDWDD